MASIKRKMANGPFALVTMMNLANGTLKTRVAFLVKKKLNSGQLNWNKLNLTNP